MPASELSMRLTPPASGAVVVAVSAGADSTALALLLAEARVGPLHLAHVQHGYRPEAAAQEVASLRELSRRTGAPLHLLAERPPPGWRSGEKIPEAAARAVRRRRLAQLAREVGARVVALAHHARDQVETQLLMVARGGGLRALCAMAAVRRSDGLVWWRPLLEQSPEALRAALRDRGLTWVEDASNVDLRLRRNAIRHRLLPSFAAGNDPLLERAPRLSALAAAALRRIAAVAAADPFAGRPSVRAGAIVRSVPELARLSPELVHELVRAWSDELFGDRPARTLARGRDSRVLCAWLRASRSGTRRSGDLVLERSGERLLLYDGAALVAPDPAAHEVVVGRAARLAGSALRVECAVARGHDAPGTPFPQSIELPAGSHVTLRVRRPGERIALSPARTIALGRILNEISLPGERDYWPIVCIDDVPVWVPGSPRLAPPAARDARTGTVRMTALLA